MSPTAAGRRDERGFTLIEVMVAMALMTMVLIAVLTVFDNFISTARVAEKRNESQEVARQAVNRLTKDLRNAVSAGSPIAQSVERAQAYDMVFQTIGPSTSPGNTTGNMRVRYCLGTSTATSDRVYRQWQGLPAAAPSDTTCPGAGWPNTQIIASSITNTLNGQTRPLFGFRFSPTTSTSLSDLVAINPEVYVDVTPGPAPPAEVPLRSGIILRNANQLPVSAFTVFAQGTKIVLNASASADPEGQSLTYQWFIDGAATPQVTGVTAQWSTTPGSHTVRLRVIDPAGAYDDLTKTVTV